MATHKATALTIDDYELPKGRKAVGTLITAALMVLSSRRKFIEPRSVIHDHILARSAKAARYSKLVQDIIFYTLFGLHGIETIWFATTKLKKHNVKITRPAWIEWVATVFAGGVFARKHFDEFIEQREIKAIKEI
ncbi:uncharacterized protein PV06_04667 [Exophiala oligosperma]|uniref:Uncharacterized protein n=1 Tax=Exophiala oligosperma TaxID=215243 RepID=A0A0D2C1K3_9EURO|nr:uncharacterized protein PV06_04667 [Exophiala oligosperma]KIW43577.1 hypothetical protein PV06_04667 [Exophiala oligosperma]